MYRACAREDAKRSSGRTLRVNLLRQFCFARFAASSTWVPEATL